MFVFNVPESFLHASEVSLEASSLLTEDVGIGFPAVNHPYIGTSLPRVVTSQTIKKGNIRVSLLRAKVAQTIKDCVITYKCPSTQEYCII